MFDFSSLKKEDELDYFEGTVVVSESLSKFLGISMHPSIECCLNNGEYLSCSISLNKWKGKLFVERSACRLCAKDLCFRLKE